MSRRGSSLEETGEFLEIIGHLVDILKTVKRPLRVLLLLVPIYWNVFLALAAWDAFTVSSWNFMGPRILTMLVFEYDCTSLLMAGLLYDDFLVMHELLRKTFRPVLSTDAAITKRFTRRRIICYVQFISITISSIMTHYVGVTPFVGDQEGDMFYRLFVRRFFGDNNTMVVLQLIVFYAVISIMTFGSIIQITMCMYSVIQINFQYHLLVDDLNNKLMFHQEDFRLIEDYSQQEKISKSLERCVEELLKIQAVATKFFRLQSPVILISGVSGGTTVLVLLYLLLGQNAPLSHVKMAGGVFVSEYMLVTFCHLGQEYSNASVEFYDKLCELPWYYWNTNNRKMLLMILTNTKELTISCFGLKELNHTFLLYISRLWYSIFCVARKVK